MHYVSRQINKKERRDKIREKIDYGTVCEFMHQNMSVCAPTPRYYRHVHATGGGDLATHVSMAGVRHDEKHFSRGVAGSPPHRRPGLGLCCRYRRGGGTLADRALCDWRGLAGRYWPNLRARAGYACAYRPSHCDCEPDLGAGRSLGRNRSARRLVSSSPLRSFRQIFCSPLQCRRSSLSGSIPTSGSAL